MKTKSIKISSIDGNAQKLDGGAMFGNAPRPMWERWITPDERGRISLATRGLLIEIDQKNILCEVGVGNYMEPKLADRYGIQNADQHVLLTSLQKRGLSHEDIDYVVLSHLHFDHAGGLLPSYDSPNQDELLFPNATFIVGQDAFARCQNPHPRDRASYIPGLAEKLKNSNRLKLVNKSTLPDFFEEHISFIQTEGHTPGQIHILVQGENEKVFFCGDCILGTPWLHAPITMGYDRFAEKVIDEKAEILPKATQEEWMMFYTHDSFHVASKCVKNEKGKYCAGQKYKTLDQFLI